MSLKIYTDMNARLWIEAKDNLEKELFKLKKNSVFQKNMENLETSSLWWLKKRSYFVLEPNYHKTKWFRENLLAIEMNETKVKMNKVVYLSLSVLDISKTVTHKF